MKKKFMMVALLLGTLMLGACVDDNETASVSAVREATAKQLKSVAAMNRAEAEASKTLAAAEVALLQAKAAAEKANAEYNNALVEQRKKSAELIELQKEEQSIENQQKKAQLEAELAQLEVTKQQAQKDLADVEAQMKQAEIDNQTALLNMQKELVKAQKDLLDCEEALANAKSEAERQEILAQRRLLETLANEYADAVDDLIQAKMDLTDAKATLIALQNNLLDAPTAKEKAISENNTKIAEYEMAIEAFKKFANYAENLDSIQAKRDELYAKQDLLRDDYYAAKSAWQKIQLDNQASDALNDSLFNKDKFSTFVRNAYWYGSYKDGDKRVQTNSAIQNILANFIGYNSYENINSIASFQPLSKKYLYQVPDRTNPDMYWLGDSLTVKFEPIPDLRGTVYEQNVENGKAILMDNITWYQDAIKEANRKLKGATTMADYPNDQGTPTKVCKNYTDSTAVVKAEYEAETDETKKADLRVRYQAVLDLENQAKNDIERYTSRAEDDQEDLDNLLDQWDMLLNYATYQEELQKAIDKRNEMQVEENAEKVAAWYAYKDKYVVYNAISTEIAAVNKLLNYSWYQDPDTGEWVYIYGAEKLSREIEMYEGWIEDLKAENEDYSEIETLENMVAMYERVVSAREAIVKSLEVIVAQTKADLDAEIAKNQTAEE